MAHSGCILCIRSEPPGAFCFNLEAALQLAAGLFAAAAGVGTNATVFVHLCVACAFLPAGLAGGGTRFYCMAEQRPLGLSAAAQQQTGGHSADVDAILVETNTADKLRHHLFGQAGISTDGTGAGALIERLYCRARLTGLPGAVADAYAASASRGCLSGLWVDSCCTPFHPLAICIGRCGSSFPP